MLNINMPYIWHLQETKASPPQCQKQAVHSHNLREKIKSKLFGKGYKGELKKMSASFKNKPNWQMIIFSLSSISVKRLAKSRFKISILVTCFFIYLFCDAASF